MCLCTVCGVVYVVVWCSVVCECFVVCGVVWCGVMYVVYGEYVVCGVWCMVWTVWCGVVFREVWWAYGLELG
jgi:hypothetical protein